MGLDVSIKVQGAEDDLLYLRNHWEFSNMFGEFAEGLLYEGFDDLRITPDTLRNVTSRLVREMQREGLDSTEIPDEIPEHFFGYGEEGELSWAELLPIYMRIVINLSKEMSKHGFLVYAWSA